MQLFLVLRTLGILLMMFSASLMPSIVISLWFNDGEIGHLVSSLLISLGLGVALWYPLRRAAPRLRSRDGFLVVSMFWVVMSLLGALPFFFGGPPLSLTDAVFESVSGFTTTGATVIVGIEKLPPSILFHRQQLQWLGGIGFIVSAVAILPMLGVAGMQLYRSETPGPMKDEKLTPRIAHTARHLWIVYGALTIACALAYWLAGMTPFDALAHSFTTVSTGGFSTYDASFAQFNSPLLEALAIIFMLMGAINFGLHFNAAYRRKPSIYWQSTEVKTFLSVVLALIAIVTSTLLATGTQPTFLGALRYTSFEVVSIITSTGFGIDDFSLWPVFLPLLLMFSSFIGGCAGSTAGGMKVIRFVIMFKGVHLEFTRLTHNPLIRPLKLEGRAVGYRVIDAVRAFFALYAVVFITLVFVLMADGMDGVSAFGAIATSMNNLGPGLGETAGNFTTVSDFAKWISALAMVLGRLELFTVLVLFSPGFWRQ